MARIRVYIRPFLPAGEYGDWIDVSGDVQTDKLGQLERRLDTSEFDIGIFTNSSVAMTLRNDHGKYSDVDGVETIFAYKRSDSLVRITWDVSDYDFYCGVSSPGEVQGGEITIYEGLLNDEGTALELRQQNINFAVLGYESLFERGQTPPWSSVAPANNLSSTLIKALVTAANASLTVPLLTLDEARIQPGLDAEWDDLTVFDNTTCREALNRILEACNSVLVMEGTTPVVSGRTPSAAVAKTFYGPGSELGLESIINIQEIRSGMNRTFNFVTWEETSLLSTDTSSVERYGVRKKKIKVDGITDNTTRQSILDSIRTEFANPKQEFKLITPINYEVLALAPLSRISVDFPINSVATEDAPIYGIAAYDEASYPVNLSSFQLLPSQHFKVIGMGIQLAKNNVSLSLRAI